MQISEDKAEEIANQLVDRLKGDTTMLDRVLSALQKRLRRLTIDNILKQGN